MKAEKTRIREHGTTVTNTADFTNPIDARISALRQIVEQKQYAKIDGTMVDIFTASAIIKIYDALNDGNKAKYAICRIPKMASIAFSLLK